MATIPFDTHRLFQQVPWKDLVRLTRFETLREVFLSLPWFAGSLVFAYLGWYLFALLCSFVFFLTGLRQVHNAYHYTLGLSKPDTEWFLFVMSQLMLGSMHAVKYNHLEHHKHCLTENDVEGKCGRMNLLQVLLFGPFFPIEQHVNALRHAKGRQYRWIVFEILLNAVVLVWVFGYSEIFWLQYHYLAMLVGHCLTALFAVWTVHHDTPDSHNFGRTQRGKWQNILTFNMFLHAEHHLFPGVPTCHLDELAGRIDKVTPEIKSQNVL